MLSYPSGSGLFYRYVYLHKAITMYFMLTSGYYKDV